MLNYKEERTEAYLSIGEQLDALWHELNTYGTIAKTHINADGTEEEAAWFSVCQSVKDRFPKPPVETEEDTTT